MNATEIALAYNAVNTNKTWIARPHSKPESGLDVVHFTTPSKLVAITYNASNGRFSVNFNKFQAAWGDYIKAISRSLHSILTTLNVAGLPFDAPPEPEGVTIEVNGQDGVTYCRYVPQMAPLTPNPYSVDRLGDFAPARPIAFADAIMPEIAAKLNGPVEDILSQMDEVPTEYNLHNDEKVLDTPE